MVRAPNYDFERRERERQKKLKNEARAASELKRTPEGESEISEADAEKH